MLKSARGLSVLVSALSRFRAVAGVGLGLLVIWQWAFIPVSGALGFLPALREMLRQQPWAQSAAPDWLAEKGPIHELLSDAQAASQRWQEATGQPQNWSLFAPDVAQDIWFVKVDLQWHDDLAASSAPGERSLAHSVSLPSENEPVDPHHFFRLGHFRIRRYESSIEVHLYNGDEGADRATRWSERIKEKLTKDWDSIQAYLRYRWRLYQRTHPGTPAPAEMILSVRHFVIPSPEGMPFSWAAPEEVPVARWALADAPPDDCLPIERYDPVSNEFKRIAR